MDFLVSAEGDPLLTATKDSPEARMKLVDANASATDYLKITGHPGLKTWEGWMDLALFHTADSNDSLYSVFYYSCGPGCRAEYAFVRYHNGDWTDMTDQVFPALPAAYLKKGYAAATKQALTAVTDVPAILYELHPGKQSILLIADPQFEDGKRVVVGTLSYSNGKFVAQ